MAVRGVYTDEEKKMIATFDQEADMHRGWAKSLNRQVATEESIKNLATTMDCWNPLWRDDNYAAHTRWGSIIAPPFYQDGISYLHWGLKPTPGMGFFDHIYIGEDWEFFKPIRVNDSFKLWRRRPQLEDVTAADGKGPRRLNFLVHDHDHINQRDEIVSSFKLYLECSFLTEPPKELPAISEYKYTKEELEFIDRAIAEEEVRGADIRYWEDVQVGDETRPVVLGPTTIWDLVIFHTGSGGPGGGLLPIREMRKVTPWEVAQDPVTGVFHCMTEVHLAERIAQMAGNPLPFHFGAMARQTMGRLATNWMGDDGFLRKFNWRHLARTPIGDALICRGKVTNKRAENGEYLVDLAIWLENLRGNITEVANATVSLFSKEVAYTQK